MRDLLLLETISRRPEDAAVLPIRCVIPDLFLISISSLVFPFLSCSPTVGHEQ